MTKDKVGSAEGALRDAGMTDGITEGGSSELKQTCTAPADAQGRPPNVLSAGKAGRLEVMLVESAETEDCKDTELDAVSGDEGA